MSCQFCWHPASQVFDSSIVVEEVAHNPGCPAIDGNMKEWEQGRDRGFVLPERELPAGKSKAFYFGVRAGKAEIEGLVQQAAEDEYCNVGQSEY